MLIGNFFELREVSITEKGWDFQLSFNPEHESYAGHFPDKPVVPGVCITQVLVECLTQSNGNQVILKHAHIIKFLNLVSPTANCTWHMHVQRLGTDTELKFISAELTDGVTPYFRFRGEVTAVNTTL